MGTTKDSGGEVAPERVRAFWAARQGLGLGFDRSSAAEVLARTGWARSVGGCNPYLALRDRAGLSRATVDAALARLEIQELTAARGCTYVVPKEDYAIALRASDGQNGDIATAIKHLGVTPKEIDRLCDRVVVLLSKTPLDPAGIKQALGDVVRSLGPEGKKRGMTTTLPLALGRLQTRGVIRRVPMDGRLDQQRYRYVTWTPSPLAKTDLTEEQVAIELARRFFRWTGPATVAQLRWWGGLGAKEAKTAVAELDLVPLLPGSDRLLFREDLDALLATPLPREPQIAFVSALDNVLHMRREVAPHLDEEDQKRPLPGAKKETVGSLADLPYHPIVDRGRIIGLWDWDGVKGELAWRTFVKKADVERRVAKEAEALATYIDEELGDARSFSLDDPASRAGRIKEMLATRW